MKSCNQFLILVYNMISVIKENEAEIRLNGFMIGVNVFRFN